ncbi:MAG: hypothetical protein IPI43_29850 [Sandaracinaceae bacterium]|nr:hypothetical protein [Sandaracinaceae bacterium]
MQPTHAGFIAAPLQMPPAHSAPCMSEVGTQTLATHASVVQELVSSQWSLVTHSRQIPVMSQCPPETHCASVVHTPVPISMRQPEEQPSPLRMPPSSQLSAPSS